MTSHAAADDEDDPSPPSAIESLALAFLGGAEEETDKSPKLADVDVENDNKK